MRRRNRRALWLGLLLAVAAPAPEAVASRETEDAGQQDARSGKLHSLNVLSRDLVERAASRRADATQFRIDATIYRESLRRLMLAGASGEGGAPGGRELHVEMVRMAALLNAAAECKTGRYITCPADLMLQLTTQQRRIDALLDARTEPG